MATVPPADLELVRAGHSTEPLRWRGFDARAALDVRFSGASRNAIVTELLTRCRLDEEDLEACAADARRLTLAGRIGGLASVVARTMDSTDIRFTLRCARVDCRENMQITIPLASLLELARTAERERMVPVLMPDQTVWQVRRPTGADQEAWRQRSYESPVAAARAVVLSLLADTLPADHVDDRQVEIIGSALDDADPLTCFRVLSECPACGSEDQHAIDLENLLLNELQRTQRRVLRDVHRLARRYGWTEAETLALPAWRRAIYLEWLAAEEA